MKKVIILTEKDLHNIISETVKKVLTEDNNLTDDIDITKIPLEILRQGYFDYRLAPVSTYYGNVLQNPVSIKEAVNDILPPDETIKNIVNKYNIPPQLLIKREHYHNIYVYTIVAVIGENDKLIEEDMGKMGYFLSKRGDVVTVEDMKYQVLQFEPTSQLQEDVTHEVKANFDILYHWTPSYNIESIERNGLIPSNKNTVFSYPPRTYLMEGDSSDEERLYLGRLLCAANNNPNNNGSYALVKVHIRNIDENIRFYYDPNSEIGIYTEQTIPSDALEVDEIIQLRKP